MDPDRDWALAAVVSVDREHAVQCQCRNCGHRIYAHVHMIVWEGGEIECWGSHCYARELAELARQRGISAEFTDAGERRLSDEERSLLLTNREALIERFRREREDAVREAEARARAKERRFEDGSLTADLGQRKRPAAPDIAALPATGVTYEPDDPRYREIKADLEDSWRRSGVDLRSSYNRGRLITNALARYHGDR